MTQAKVLEIKEKVPKIGNVKSLGFDDLTQDEGSGLWDAEIKAFIEATNLKGLFFNDDWVFILLDLISDHVSMSPMIVKKVVKEEGGKVLEETVDSHPVLMILENPNEFQTYSIWMYNYVVELDLMGNAMVFYGKQKQQLVIIPTETAQLHFNDKGRFSGYNVINQSLDVGNLDHITRESQMFFKKEQIWHQRRPNPKSLLYGLSPFVPNRKNILFSRYTQDWLNSFYLKGATPTIALTMERNVDEQSAHRFLRSFEMAYTGRRNMRRPLIMPKGVSADTLSPSVADQNLVELIKQNRESIINILRVPKHALSLAESGSLGSEEHKQALKFFYTSAIIPTQVKIQDHLTRQFKREGLLEEDERLVFDNSEVEVLRDDLFKKAELSEKLKSVWTLNEIRAEIWDKEKLDGGDELPGKVEQPFAFGGEKQVSIPSMFGKESIPPVEVTTTTTEETKDFVEYKDKDYRDAVVKAVLHKYSDHLVWRAKQNLEIVEGVHDKTQEFWEDLLKSWGKKAQKIVDNNFKRPKQKADEVKPPGKRFLKRLFQRALEEDEEKWLDFHTQNFLETIEDSYDVQVDIVVGEDNKQAIQALKERDKKKRRLILEARGLKTFANISKTQTEAIMREVEKGVEDQIPLRDIGEAISERFANISETRAETIARTEALTAVSIGKQAALENTKEVIPDIIKVWINLGDTRVRGHPDGPPSDADHWNLQGEPRDVDEPFSNGLMYPRDVKSDDPSEIVNCRCDFLMVPDEDLEDLDV